MSTPNDGGPAFPHSHSMVIPERGMSLRDWFAGQAMLGLLSDSNTIRTCDHLGKAKDQDADEFLAEAAYGFADAMLAERSKNK